MCEREAKKSAIFSLPFHTSGKNGVILHCEDTICGCCSSACICFLLVDMCHNVTLTPYHTNLFTSSLRNAIVPKSLAISSLLERFLARARISLFGFVRGQ